MNLLGSIIGGLLGGHQNSSPLQNVLGSLLGGGVGGGMGGGMLGGLLGGQQQPMQQPMQGGLMGLIDRFQQAGMGNVAQSWVSTGPNQPVSPHQLEQVFGQQEVQQMAQQANMPPQDLLSQLSQFLPQVVDRLTPNGQLPPADAFGGPQDGGMSPTGGGKTYRT